MQLSNRNPALNNQQTVKLGLKQRCWAHLIRDFKELAKDKKEIDAQLRRLLILYKELKILNTKPPDEKKIRKAGVSQIISANTIPGKTAKVDVSSSIAKVI